MDSTIELILVIILIILIALSAFFSASETALMSLSKLQLRKMKDENKKSIEDLLYITEDSSRLLTTILVGNNIVNIGASSIATYLFTEWYGVKGVGIATTMMTILILIFGEITPKSIANNNTEKVAILVSKAIKFVFLILKPIVSIFDITKSIIFRIFRIQNTDDKPLITEEELRTMVTVSHEEGVLEIEETEIIHNVFEFSDKQAKDAMIKRMDILAVEKTVTYNEIIKIFKEQKFSRIPVYEENIDNIVGILNIKDIVFLTQEEIYDFEVLKYVREPFFTYEYKQVPQLLEEMKVSKNRIAIVVDEYGGTSGLLTIENLVEELVGDISDEYDNEEDAEIFKISDYEYSVLGSVNISDVNEELDIDLSSEDFDSIGGYVIENIKGFPQKDDVIKIDNVEFHIEDVGKNKINKIRVKIN